MATKTKVVKVKVIKVNGKPLAFITDPAKIKKGLDESVKSLEKRVNNLHNSKYISQEMLRKEISI